MSFNPGAPGGSDDRNLFVPEETDRVELETEIVAALDVVSISHASSAAAAAAAAASTKQDEKKQDVLVAEYTMIDEDYGMGHLLRRELLRDPAGRVSFAGCRVPHPQEAVLKIRFHSTPQHDPDTILCYAIERCIRRIDSATAALLKAPSPLAK